MKALIETGSCPHQITSWVYDSSNNFFVPIFEPILDAGRVAQVEEMPFEVAPSLFWIDCAQNVVADAWYYQKSTQLILPIPDPAPFPALEEQPVTTGAQTL